MKPIRIFLTVLAAPLLTLAAPPAWWTTNGVIVPGASQNNEGPVVLGQLKHVSNQAKEYLDQKLVASGGAGKGIVAFTNSDPNSNAAIATVGQLKAVAKPFYDRLREAGYNTREILRSNGYPSTWTSLYPWSQTVTPGNESPATIGQLKLTFAFDLSDSDFDGLPDYWEMLWVGNLTALGPGNADKDFDGIRDTDEFTLGLDPNASSTSSNTREISYDAVGRLTTDGAKTYSSDEEGNLQGAN